MLKIDLHTHSNHSDGTDTPTELMHQAQKAGLDIIALTDHDVTSGWEEAAQAVPLTQVGLVRGTEISCAWHGITVHLLSYLQNPENVALKQAHEHTIRSRQGRAKEMVTRLGEDYPLTWEDVLQQAPKTKLDGPIGRPHIADALVAKGCFPTRSDCFETVLHPRSRYYVKHWSLDPIEAVELVRAAGGVPVIAHPRARMRQKLLPTKVILEMAKHGLAGLEVHHRDNSHADREFLIEIADAYQLLITGSSDYHGTGKSNRLGENLTKPSVFEEIAQQGELEVLLP
ncbi:PHP domain-containing protein [Gleimia sp. 6138-11-ORH1]|uniref:PHP domain-containing protein n=1 Tax=Gleimia sp. 6138-11-ORH1 TaxID=2973937 RepID=UPI002167F89C|nr:PHP domain-containing protein [Gleimia sp. 6138-11-ORH1]MCS4483975.1 PHP domain-containing protein [Gleimia sp. 6138-11-ORH1]